TTYLPLVLSSTTNVVDINGQQFNIWGSASGFTSGRIIVDPVFSAIGYQNAGVFDGLKILTNGNAEFSNSGVTRFFNQVRFDSTLSNGTYTYTLPGATGTIALVGGAGVGTVTSVSALSIGTSGTDISSTVANSTTTPVITLNVPTASATNRGALSSTDWTTFNNKQNALTNPVTGTGTTNYLPKFTGASTIGNSQIFDNGSNVGINRNNPTRTLDILGGSGIGTVLKLEGASGTTTYLQLAYNGATNSQSGYIGYNSSSQMQFFTNDTLRATLDASGNLGLGVSPSAWDTTLSKAIQLNGGSLWGYSTSQINLLQNGFYNTSGDIAYVNTASASAYRQISGVHSWYNAPSGTAGNAISFTQAMTLNASGNLSLGNTNDTYKLDVTGTGRFSGTSLILGSNGNGNTQFTINSTTGTAQRIAFQVAGTDQWLIGNGAASQTTNFEIYNTTGTIVYSVNRTTNAATFTGAATFSSSVSLTSGYLSVDGFGNKDTNYITMRSGFAPSDSGGIGFKAIDPSGSGTDGLACYGHDGISL
ncbi:MAG: hypothetical protein ACOVOV_01070, partial [Dolichospermum sp.]